MMRLKAGMSADISNSPPESFVDRRLSVRIFDLIYSAVVFERVVRKKSEMSRLIGITVVREHRFHKQNPSLGRILQLIPTFGIAVRNIVQLAVCGKIGEIKFMHLSLERAQKA